MFAGRVADYDKTAATFGGAVIGCASMIGLCLSTRMLR